MSQLNPISLADIYIYLGTNLRSLILGYIGKPYTSYHCDDWAKPTKRVITKEQWYKYMYIYIYIASLFLSFSFLMT